MGKHIDRNLDIILLFNARVVNSYDFVVCSALLTGYLEVTAFLYSILATSR